MDEGWQVCGHTDLPTSSRVQSPPAQPGQQSLCHLSETQNSLPPPCSVPLGSQDFPNPLRPPPPGAILLCRAHTMSTACCLSPTGLPTLDAQASRI